VTDVTRVGAPFYARTPAGQLAGTVTAIRLRGGASVRAVHVDDWPLVATVTVRADGRDLEIPITGPLTAPASVLH
jgi:hypothetical protein